jgi:hypothetical protein
MCCRYVIGPSIYVLCVSSSSSYSSFLFVCNSEYRSNISTTFVVEDFLKDEILVASAGSNATVLKSRLWILHLAARE